MKAKKKSNRRAKDTSKDGVAQNKEEQEKKKKVNL